MKLSNYQIIISATWALCAAAALLKSQPGTAFEHIAKDADGIILEFEKRFSSMIDKRRFWK